MRELAEHEVSMASGGMHSIGSFSLQNNPNQSSTIRATLGPATYTGNTGTLLSCAAFGAGAGSIIGTGAAIGAVAVTKNPGTALSAYSQGQRWGGVAASAACSHFENQQFKH